MLLKPDVMRDVADRIDSTGDAMRRAAKARADAIKSAREVPDGFVTGDAAGQVATAWLAGVDGSAASLKRAATAVSATADHFSDTDEDNGSSLMSVIPPFIRP
ncbi:hypothetical protein LX16_4896 [Stackebrandtia albiflava]|uniref:Uncharacterized protein n=1 Tax=Stackebrandtia albiflava TaxID=406432 RepID=A0A562UQ34_9ACTN|nr:hypothetical protein [Stackebrandtia albiflava]TWJ07735.1 hypothetical protein LX16_4896 [Stackebrandtia albiflava]